MKRREFLKTLSLGIIGFGVLPEILAHTAEASADHLSREVDSHLKDYLHKMEHVDEPQWDDVYLDRGIYKIFKSTVMRLRRLQRLAGHGNFQLLNFDRGLRLAGKYSEVGRFSKAELTFMEAIFYEEGQRYGFSGQKPLKNITDQIKREEVVKIPYGGNCLYKGAPFEIYKKIRHQVGEQVLLTSGVRGIMKQFLLFLNKAYENNGNLALASRSLAPPGYSFHGTGDFDIGQAGLGALNFTECFTNTKVYKRLRDLGYLKLRYHQKNLLGVRFEPWHIKVNS